MKYNVLSMNNDKIDSECMICHCGSDDEDNPNSNERLISVVHINYLHKECYCNYKIHINCLKDWLSKKPSCPICNVEMFYLTSENDELDKSVKEKEIQESSINKCLGRLLCCACSSSSTNSRNNNR